jgi:UDP-GlcNAc:undecaprenyl-phosphate GlcNAc-1-phosphate transferase
MPLLGGLAIYVACVVSILFFAGNPSWTELLGILGGATFVTVAGLLDDRGLVHHQLKLFIAMPMAAVLLIASGVHLNLFTGWFGDSTLWSTADYALSFIWIVGITASFSIFDHMDGLCAGVAAIAAAFFLALMSLGGQIYASIVAAAVFGAALGFVGWNFNPAKLFMGDAGAMFLGFMMAVLGLLLRLPEQSPLTSWLVAILVLGVAIFDTLLVIVSRSRRGLLPFSSPGKDHTAHRLANLGLGQRRAVLALYGLGIVCGTLGLVVSRLGEIQGYLVVVFTVVAALIGVALMERAPYERQGKGHTAGAQRE